MVGFLLEIRYTKEETPNFLCQHPRNELAAIGIVVLWFSALCATGGILH